VEARPKIHDGDTLLVRGLSQDLKK
jgi:hypothetical protein